jgi:hypothetical protein
MRAAWVDAWVSAASALAGDGVDRAALSAILSLARGPRGPPDAVLPDDFDGYRVDTLLRVLHEHPRLTERVLAAAGDRRTANRLDEFAHRVRAALLRHAADGPGRSAGGVHSTWVLAVRVGDGEIAELEPWQLAAAGEVRRELVGSRSSSVHNGLRLVTGLRRAVDHRIRMPGRARMAVLAVWGTDVDFRIRAAVDATFPLPEAVQTWLMEWIRDARGTARAEEAADKLDGAEGELEGLIALEWAVEGPEALRGRMRRARFDLAALRQERPGDKESWSRAFRDMAALVAEDLADHASERAPDGTWPLAGVLRRITSVPVEPVPDPQVVERHVRDAVFVDPYLLVEGDAVRSVFADVDAQGLRLIVWRNRLTLALEDTGGNEPLRLHTEDRNRVAEDASPMARRLLMTRDAPLSELVAAIRAGHVQLPGDGLRVAVVRRPGGPWWRFAAWDGRIVSAYEVASGAPDVSSLERSAFPDSAVRVESPYGQGSGVILAPAVVATAAHVVRDVPVADLRVDGHPVGAVVGLDPVNDLAFLHVPALEGRTPAPLATALAEAGDEVIAFGWPDGARTALLGKVRSDDGVALEVLMTTDGGLSGGSMVGRHGVLGIHLGREQGTQNAHARSAPTVRAGLRDARALFALLPSLVQDLVARAATVTPGEVQRVTDGAVLIAEWRLDELVKAATPDANPAAGAGGVWWPDVEGPPGGPSHE